MQLEFADQFLRIADLRSFHHNPYCGKSAIQLFD